MYIQMDRNSNLTTRLYMVLVDFKYNFIRAVYIYIYIYVYMYTYICIHIFIYTYLCVYIIHICIFVKLEARL
jgi:hypothetical protein